LHRERKCKLDTCLLDIAETMGMSNLLYTMQLNEDPVALADRLAAVEIKTEDIN